MQSGVEVWTHTRFGAVHAMFRTGERLSALVECGGSCSARAISMMRSCLTVMPSRPRHGVYQVTSNTWESASPMLNSFWCVRVRSTTMCLPFRLWEGLFCSVAWSMTLRSKASKCVPWKGFLADKFGPECSGQMHLQAVLLC